MTMLALQRTTSTEEAFRNHVDPLQFYHTLRRCNDSYISKHINRALDVLTDSVRLYGPGRVFSSYNGGKDADVIMHLLRAVYAKYSADKGVEYRPQQIYFYNDDEFGEVLAHIDRAEKAYGLDLTRYDQGIVQVCHPHIGFNLCVM